jgi:CRP-like cAMP-binding protein
VDLLAGVPLFAGLGPSERVALVERGRTVAFRAGEVLCLDGDPAEWLLVVSDGRLKVSVHSIDGAELIVETLGAGQAVGELGVLSGGRRSATVTALTAGTGFSVPRKAIVDLVNRRPEVACPMIEALALRVREATGIAADLVFLDLSGRLAKYLLEKPATDLTQGQLAARLGASRQRINATLADFERRGWIAIEGRTVRTVDSAGLRTMLPH